jgi:hypothetical protein
MLFLLWSAGFVGPLAAIRWAEVSHSKTAGPGSLSGEMMSIHLDMVFALVGAIACVVAILLSSYSPKAKLLLIIGSLAGVGLETLAILWCIGRAYGAGS